MPLFRRKHPATDDWFAVGVDGHRVWLGGDGGCQMLDEIDGYIGAIASRVSTRADGRDSIAVLNAKMDHSEMVDSAFLVLTLALEELVARGVLMEDEVPAPPPRAPLSRELATYDYIQEIHRRSLERMEWMRRVDAILRSHRVTVLRPEPPADTR
jgi:hypothetical protein